MDARTLGLIFASLTLALSAFVYGAKFFRRGNYLLAGEWLVVGVSASNAAFFFYSNAPTAFLISHFFDAFSRAFGIPVIGVLGLMAVTHGFKPSVRADIGLFAASFAGALVLVAVPALQGVLPYFYLATWTLFTLYGAYLVLALARTGKAVNAITLTIGLAAGLAIAAIYDFYKIPGEEKNVILNFFFLAEMTWAFLLMVTFYAYDALARARA